MNGYRVMLTSLLALTTWSAEALTLDQPSIDAFLGKLGADNQYDPAKGVNWSVLPGPFYTPELKLGLGMAVAGIYRVDAADKTTQNSSVSLTGYVSASGALGMGSAVIPFLPTTVGDCLWTAQ